MLCIAIRKIKRLRQEQIETKVETLDETDMKREKLGQYKHHYLESNIHLPGLIVPQT